MTLPTIQSLWIGDPLSKIEQLCIQSFLDNGHEFHLYVYDDIGNIPDGATVKDASTILPSELIYRNDGGAIAGFSDWFRYELLAKHGEMWVDMDMVCLQPFAFEGDNVVVGRDNGAVLGGRHEIWRWLSDECRDYPKFKPWDSKHIRWRKLRRRLMWRGREGTPYGQIGGPRALEEALRYFDLLKLAKPRICFYPIQYMQADSIFDDTYADGYDFGADVYGLHVWNNTSRRIRRDKNADYPHGSLIEQLKRKHKI